MHENGRHIANYVCAITQNGEEFTADGVDCVEKLVKHFRRPKFEGFTFIAHNASGFDSFILLSILQVRGCPQKLYFKAAGWYICTIVYLNNDT